MDFVSVSALRYLDICFVCTSLQQIEFHNICTNRDDFFHQPLEQDICFQHERYWLEKLSESQRKGKIRTKILWTWMRMTWIFVSATIRRDLHIASRWKLKKKKLNLKKNLREAKEKWKKSVVTFLVNICMYHATNHYELA